MRFIIRLLREYLRLSNGQKPADCSPYDQFGTDTVYDRCEDVR